VFDPLSWLFSLIGTLPVPILQTQFMQRAVATMLFLAPLCAVMGTLVVQFRMAFFSDSIAHSAFTGIALGLLLGIDPRWSLPIFSVVVGIVIMRLKRQGEQAMDTTMGVVFSTTIALGLAVISAKKSLGKSLPGFLYGDILAINDQELLLIILLSFGCFVFLCFWYNRLLLTGLQSAIARVHGVPVDGLEIAFSSLLALVVAFSIRAVGILLVTALLLIPAAAARNLARSAGSQVWWAIAISLVSSMAGLATSVRFDIASGAAMILWSVAIFCLSLWRRRS